jgi:hypothetical protein
MAVSGDLDFMLDLYERRRMNPRARIAMSGGA